MKIKRELNDETKQQHQNEEEKKWERKTERSLQDVNRFECVCCCVYIFKLLSKNLHGICTCLFCCTRENGTTSRKASASTQIYIYIKWKTIFIEQNHFQMACFSFYMRIQTLTHFYLFSMKYIRNGWKTLFYVSLCFYFGIFLWIHRYEIKWKHRFAYFYFIWLCWWKQWNDFVMKTVYIVYARDTS